MSVGGDPSYASVSALLHMNGANGGTTFTDNGPAGLTVTPAGNAQTLSAQFKFGPTSMGPSSGTSPRLTFSSQTGFAFPGQFTVEMWVWLNSTAADFFCTSDTDVNGWMFYGNNGGTIGINNSTSVLLTSSTVGLTSATWQHVAFTRDGSNVVRAFIDGVVDATTITNNTNVVASTAGSTKVGTNASPEGVGKFDGFMDDFRVTKGVCRYTANFARPISPFPNGLGFAGVFPLRTYLRR